jgi:hypothetical protein
MKIIKNNKKFIVCVVITILLLIIVILSTLLIYVITKKDKDDNESKNESAITTTPTLQISPTVVTSPALTPNPLPTSEPTDPGDFWSLYTNTKYSFNLKYPIDLDYTESSLGSNIDQIEFKSGDTIVFRIWIKTGGDLDSLMSNMLSNQCTQTIQFSEATFGNNTFRKAADIPNQNCLDSLNITRKIELAVYGKILKTNTYFAILNEGLNNEQLNILLRKLNFE